MQIYVDLRSYRFKIRSNAEMTHCSFNCSRGLVVWHILFQTQAYSCLVEQIPSNAFYLLGPRPLLLSSAEYTVSIQCAASKHTHGRHCKGLSFTHLLCIHTMPIRSSYPNGFLPTPELANNPAEYFLFIPDPGFGTSSTTLKAHAAFLRPSSWAEGWA